MKTFLVILLGLCGAIVLVVPASSSGETATALRMPEELDELLAPVAHPARWGDSGIMTFLVNQQAPSISVTSGRIPPSWSPP